MRRLLLLVGLAACGDDGDSGPYKITLTTTYPELKPELVAVQDGDAPWEVLASDATTFEVTSKRYAITMACKLSLPDNSFTYRRVVTYAQTVSDPRDVPRCESQIIGGNTTSHMITGQMKDAGSVWIDSGESMSATPSWTFMSTVPDGTYDLFAYDTAADKFAVRRGVAVSADTNVPMIDLATDGRAWGKTTFSLDGVDLGMENISSELYLDFANHNSWYVDTENFDVAVLPDDALVAEDLQYVLIRSSAKQQPAGDIRYERGAEVDYRSAKPKSYTLPENIGGAKVSGKTMSWTALPAQTKYVSVSSIASSFFDYTYATTGWLDGSTEVSVDHSMIPGWDAMFSPAPEQMDMYAVDYFDEKKFDDVYAKATWVAPAMGRALTTPPKRMISMPRSW